MESGNRFIRFVSGRDWRIWFGLVVTFTWILGGLYFVIASVRADPDQDLTLDVIGNFLEGAFAPLAFLWLVLGLFMQQKELANNTEMLRRTSEQSEKQTMAIAATEMNARQETFFKIAENVKHQLGGITGMLFASGLGPVGSNRYSREEISAMFEQAGNGDHEIFARQFMSLDFLEEGGLQPLLYETDIRRRHTRNFRRTYERLVDLAAGCDVGGIIVDSLHQSAFGLLYQRSEEYMPGDVRRASGDAAQDYGSSGISSESTSA